MTECTEFVAVELCSEIKKTDLTLELSRKLAMCQIDGIRSTNRHIKGRKPFPTSSEHFKEIHTHCVFLTPILCKQGMTWGK